MTESTDPRKICRSIIYSNRFYLTYGLVLLNMNIELYGRIGLTTRDACSFFFASASAAAAAAFFFASSSARAFAAAADSSRPGNLSKDAIRKKNK